MKHIKIYISLFLLGLSFSSCQKFVAIPKDSSQSFIETANDCQLILDNYDLFNTGYPIDGEISADDYYLDDTRYNDPYTLTIEDRILYTWQSNAIRVSAQQWVGPYNKIYHANLVLEAVAKLEGKEQPSVLNNLKGSALFLRAYALWHVAQLYAKPYGATSNQDPGVPVHLVSDINDTPGRGTVKQTYDQIIADLREATVLLNPTSSVASRPNKIAAYAMLSRVYLAMEDYSNALTSASSALALKPSGKLIDFNGLDQESFAPFRRFNNEVIFHSVVLSQNGMLEPGYGYENLAIIAPEIIASYQDNDLRKTVYVKENTDLPTPMNTWRFVGNYESAVGSAKLFNGLAFDELYLNRAECYARANDAANAMADLNTLLITRWVKDTYTNMTATNAGDALAKVLAERRKELLMRGIRWTDLRRLNKDSRFAKNISRTVEGTTYTLPANDLRYTLLIPQEVITNSALPQNLR
ncbi:RagB/SusD family nutrient uptake outer membrane protein [Pedobacter sp. MC2016-14]|uniref:RagB/SusD family nutrient uptake outer membrane protein n=1 Tax=Pedobacter sp. MC2016-14 TaxID=2897327 RepID=UPI001E5A1C4A|nr:RagB/SusD family nutrient uptake outer membrane protein [Pedobacter sp. MC2016-14]MCD0489291.1 RagB/SusD family nutrient uptake outer membrane protein [Pedobacter sp. MC2016-14]